MNPASSFVLSLLGTLLVVRAWTMIFHDCESYGTPHEKSFTPTGYLRRRMGRDIHHYHLSIPVLIFATILLAVSSLRSLDYSLLGIGVSLFIDQVVPMTFKIKDYFNYKHLFTSVLVHVIISALVLVFYLF